MLTSRQIRQEFIDFFVARHGHTFVPSSPVVPHDDPTLLFANAGMNQFKPYFLGAQQPAYPRAANTQKCIRAGGKHNDLDDVGRSRRHHTFFEMLGNWSFGDYFKKEAIEMAWELLTQAWKLDPSRLHVTCFEGDTRNGIPRDTEAAEIWKKVAHLPDDHIHYFGKDNFWEMGDTGPCGPCSEIYIDRTPDKSGGPQVNGTDPRVMEIWNLVFIQYNRDSSGMLTPLPAQHVDTGMGFERICQVLQNKDDNFAIDLWEPLFAQISKLSGRQYTGQFPPTNTADPAIEAANPQLRTDIAYRVIADHVRCLTFALTDGAIPSNDGRGYVLRRILRRAVRFGRQQLDLRDPFLFKLVDTIVTSMADAFPELKKNPKAVTDLIHEEEISFGKTLDTGLQLSRYAMFEALNTSQCKPRPGIANPRCVVYDTKDHGTYFKIQDAADQTQYPSSEADFAEADLGPEIYKQFFKAIPQIKAEAVFRLYDTYGFPIDLTQVMASERGMTVDVDGYNQLMEQARIKARGNDSGSENFVDAFIRKNCTQSEFVGYDTTNGEFVVHFVWSTGSNIYMGNSKPGPTDLIGLWCSKTPFYAESGGQVGDIGTIESPGGFVFQVTDTRKESGVHYHVGFLQKGSLEYGGSDFNPRTVKFTVDADRRARIMANHTATHVLNHKLRAVLGEHVMQKGSLVDDTKTRFDFAHHAALEDEELAKVEELVNADIRGNLPVSIALAPQEKALKIHGLRAVFGEKYPPEVRVMAIGVSVDQLLADPANKQWHDYSVEFCGGTHLAHTGDAKAFAIIAEEAVGKGVRRITAVTGDAAIAAQKTAADLAAKINALKSQAPSPAPGSGRGGADLPQQVTELAQAINSATLATVQRSALRAALAELQKKVKELDKEKNKASVGAAIETARQIAESTADGQVIVAEIPGVDADALRAAMDVIRAKKPAAALLLGAAAGDKVSFVAAVPQDLIKKGLKAGDWVKEAAKVAGGGGGGRPDMAQAGGKDASKLAEALATGKTFAEAKIK